MSEILFTILSFVAGLLLGAIFFGGLWFTVKKLVNAKMPAIWMLSSFVLRIGITLVAFYYISLGNWQRLLICVFGFIVARFAVVHFTKPNDQRTMQLKKETTMTLSPDETVFWQQGFININLTIVTTWVIMLVLVIGSKLITRKLKTDIQISRWQCILEMIVTTINQQIKNVGLDEPENYIGFIGSLFLFIAACNICIIFPFYQAPTGSLSTTAALAIAVFLAVPYFGIQKSGVGGYLKTYVQPTFIMLPFNIISELSRTLALAVSYLEIS